ncbi:MAG: recombinase family protein [Butyrivibrio sp.]|nr:recombinase family protein [Acetatifactor muris]MCM1558232.1 recombinase family protein [Butyrivibrio sp.]
MEERKIRFSIHNKLYKDKWSVGIYVRLSDEDRDKRNKEDMSRSIENQIEYIRNYIELSSRQDMFGMKEYEVYADDDHTGMDFDREGFRRMMNAVRNEEIDCIIVKNLSRLGRYDTDMQKYLEKEFEQPGKEVRVIAIGDNYDSLYHEVSIADRFHLLINREYSEQQHRNVSIGMRTMQKNGLFVGAFAPYGYVKDPQDKHHLCIDLVAAEVVKRIFEEYISGISPKEIAARLTRDGIVNPAAYKKLHGSNFRSGKKISDEEIHWRGDGVKSILMDEVYTGTIVQHKQVRRKLTDKKPMRVPKEQWIRCEGMHEPVISREKWDIAQSLMKSVKHDTTKADEVTIFKGILKCGDCGHAMRKRWDKYHQVKSGDTVKYLYYNCGTYRDYSRNLKELGDNAPKCTGHYISDKVIRNIIIDDMNKIISKVENLSEMVKKNEGLPANKSNSIRQEIKKKEKEIERYGRRLKKAREMLYDETITKEEFESDTASIKTDISSLEKEIAILQKSASSVAKVISNSWIQRLLQNGRITELDRATVVEFIDKICVYEDKHIEIVYKFSDEFDYLFTRFI